ncbi:hypothetical protein QR680_016235 [Steinernema hermaphroditum]|uniref:Methyltransferase domain-containing protein n=1 Tax=Steinernema hermaphroditum TaxID=289476 RepID=A0AA39HBG8_9BILA|nr:hypothetical protein QR680_016235 [Steinernema hermaphroditum]
MGIPMRPVMVRRVFCITFLVLLAISTITVLIYSKKATRLYSNVLNEIFCDEKEDAVPIQILEIYRKQVEGRKILLQLHNTATTYFDNLYNVAAPEVFCPGLVRIGDLSDGGKWICSPHLLPNPCVIYSLGINNEFSFDAEIYEMSKCQIHAFDKDEMRPETVQFYHRINATLDKAMITKETNVSAAAYSFTDVVQMYKPKRIDVLKIDIEGGEYDVATQIATTPICQILIELHWKPYSMVTLLKTLSSHNFYLFHHEINGGTHNASEFSLIHESCLRDYGVTVVYGKYFS